MTAPISPDAPPLFIAVAHDDARAADNCVALYCSWKATGRPAELHVYAQGGHGFGIRRRAGAASTWPARAVEWLRGIGLLPAEQPSG